MIVLTYNFKDYAETNDNYLCNYLKKHDEMINFDLLQQTSESTKQK